MGLAGTGEIVTAAKAAGVGAGSFNVVGIEHAEAIVAGAVAARAPVILQISENCVKYHGSVGPVVAAALAIAEAAGSPVAVHLDHATSADLVRAAVRAGVGSVMFDASALDYGANVETTAEIAEWCHDRGVWMEAELGEIGGKDGVHASTARTRPDEAAAYVAATGVDALAVARLDLALIKEISAAVPVPLVLHGSSGVPDEMLAEAVRAGLTKINIATQLNKVFTSAVRDCLISDQRVVDPRKYLAAGREAVAAEVTRLLTIIGASGAAR
jgi:fructose-bisphosphate aldolase, class II